MQLFPQLKMVTPLKQVQFPGRKWDLVSSDLGRAMGSQLCVLTHPDLSASTARNNLSDSGRVNSIYKRSEKRRTHLHPSCTPCPSLHPPLTPISAIPLWKDSGVMRASSILSVSASLKKILCISTTTSLQRSWKGQMGERKKFTD